VPLAASLFFPIASAIVHKSVVVRFRIHNGTPKMSKRLSALAFGLAIFLTSSLAQAQFGGIQIQVGGYGSGVRVGSYGYGNGYYGNGYYGNGYYGGNGYGNGFASPYYSNYSSRYGSYPSGYYNNGFGYHTYPTYGYGYSSPRYYAAPVRSYAVRRYR
jgi:hypothetical protein